MEFNIKLQELRRQKGLTQEELAARLCVSRTAISKWESGRGYPNIDSLKAIAQVFSVTIDELLSGDELLNIAQQENKQKEKSTRDLVYGLLDISVAILLFIPFFGQKIGDKVVQISLLSLTEASLYLRVMYFVLLLGMILCGVLTLALQNCRRKWWVALKSKISIILNGICAMLFIVSLQPYAAVLLFAFLLIKLLMLVKKR